MTRASDDFAADVAEVQPEEQQDEFDQLVESTREQAEIVSEQPLALLEGEKTEEGRRMEELETENDRLVAALGLPDDCGEPDDAAEPAEPNDDQ